MVFEVFLDIPLLLDLLLELFLGLLELLDLGRGFPRLFIHIGRQPHEKHDHRDKDGEKSVLFVAFEKFLELSDHTPKSFLAFAVVFAARSSMLMPWISAATAAVSSISEGSLRLPRMV